MADTITNTETSFQRANRLADEAKARKRAAYDAGPQRWRDCDWRDESANAVHRPTERAVFLALFGQTQHRNIAFMAAMQIVQRATWPDNLRAILAMRGLTLLWWDDTQQRLVAKPATRGKVDAVVVPIKRRAA